jgi:sugar transferase (PEP-CTERM/EpsH1 system associated)
MNTEPPLIAHIIFRLDVGGMENGIVNLINNIPESRYRHAIICLTEYTQFSQRIRVNGVQLIALKKKPGKDLAVYWRLWKTLRELKPDIVHTRNLGTIDTVFPAALAGVRFRVHGEHGWDMADLHGRNRKYRRLRRICNFLISHHITVSSHLQAWLQDHLGVPAEKISQIYNGVDTEKFSPSGTGRDAVFDTGFVTPGALVIGTVGRMAEVKNQMLLVEAFVILLGEYPEARNRLRLVMIGDGPDRSKLRDRLTAAGVLELAFVPGECDDVSRILKGVDIFVMPSLNEGISNTILEAMATGLPVVATDVGGNPELVEADSTGLLVKPGDPRGLAGAIRRYLDQPELMAVHGAAGRARVEKQFSLAKMVAGYLAVYDSRQDTSLQMNGE